jgi:hypothetical protein
MWVLEARGLVAIPNGIDVQRTTALRGRRSLPAFGLSPHLCDSPCVTLLLFANSGYSEHLGKIPAPGAEASIKSSLRLAA